MGGDIMHAIVLKIGRLFAVTAAVLSAWMLTASAPLHAQSSDSGFDAYVQSLWPKAQARGVSRQVFDRVTAGLRYNPRVIALDRDNLGSPPTNDTPIPNFAPYKAKHVDAARIRRGLLNTAAPRASRRASQPTRSAMVTTPSGSAASVSPSPIASRTPAK